MPEVVACAVVHDDPPQIFLAEDEETLSWVLALHLIARRRGSELEAGMRDALREALRDEQWGEAVELWMRDRPEIDVYPSFDLYRARDVAMAAQELEFTPLFRD